MSALPLAKVYPITGCPNSSSLTHLQLAQSFLKAGIRFFQVRDKQLPDHQYYHQLVKIKALCEKYDARFVINDRIDLVLAVGADGVHLGQKDLSVKVARRLLGKEAIIGLSTHNRRQFKNAQLQALSYLAIGPIFSTKTKLDAEPALGVKALPQLISGSRYPVVAIGGISVEKAPTVWQTGVDSVAIISDITHVPNPEKKVSDYLILSKKAGT